MRCISLFIHNIENRHLKLRKEIVNYLKLHKNEFSHSEFETEIGIVNINQYLEYIEKPKSWSGELEKYEVEELYNINIADYLEKVDNNDITCHKFLYDYNHDRNYLKDLCILTSINNNHYNLIYDKIYNVFKNNKLQLIFLNNMNMNKNKNTNIAKIELSKFNNNNCNKNYKSINVKENNNSIK